nr:unnamed protein product [Callosobruchus chinensis]
MSDSDSEIAKLSRGKRKTSAAVAYNMVGNSFENIMIEDLRSGSIIFSIVIDESTDISIVKMLSVAVSCIVKPIKKKKKLGRVGALDDLLEEDEKIILPSKAGQLIADILYESSSKRGIKHQSVEQKKLCLAVCTCVIQHNLLECRLDRRDERLRNARLRRALREHNPVMDLSDNEFKAHYRLTKDLFLQLCEEISPYLPRPRRRTAISVECKVLTTLSFYATGSYQKPIIGMSYLHGLSQSGASNTVREVTNDFNHPNILRRFIRFPQTVQKRQAIINGFSNKFQIPGCLGCIDCTHVALVRPNENEERFFNRKHYHSRNVQIISTPEV